MGNDAIEKLKADYKKQIDRFDSDYNELIHSSLNTELKKELITLFCIRNIELINIVETMEV